MKYHSVYMIFNLLYLKYQIEDNSTIKIEDLRNAFYEYEYSINDMNNTKQSLDFDSELEQVLEDFSSIFEVFDDEISFTSDEEPDFLYETIPEFLEEGPTSIDIYMEDSINNESIYYALKLKPPFEEMQNIFETSKAIITLYNIIIKLEMANKDTSAIIKIIQFHKNNLKEFFKKADNKTRIKIRLCLAYYNEALLSDKAKPNINSSWHIALLSNDEKLKCSLAYDRIYSLLEKEFETDEEMESKDLTNGFNSAEDNNEEFEELPPNFLADTCYAGDEVEYFFANFIIYLNSHINELNNPEVKKILLERKYLLLATDILKDTEDYYLENGSLDNLPLPAYIKEWFTNKSFDFLIANFGEILRNIRIPNEKINSENNAQIIINLLLLKCYLTLSLNQDIKNELLYELMNYEYYKKPEYSYITKLIDDIIFPNKGINRKRKKKDN